MKPASSSITKTSLPNDPGLHFAPPCPIAKSEVTRMHSCVTGKGDSTLRDNSGTPRGVRNNKGSQLIGNQRVASRFSFAAEGMGLEPTTPKGAPHFECGCSPIRLPSGTPMCTQDRGFRQAGVGNSPYSRPARPTNVKHSASVTHSLDHACKATHRPQNRST